jgi:hypothetical protein
MADSVPYVASIHGGLSGYIKGCIPSNGSDATNDIDFSTGFAFDGTRCYQVGAKTKRADAGWALGTAVGGMASVAGTPITFSANTDYHWFLLFNPSTGESDFGCDTSVIAANLLTTAAVVSAGFTVALRDTSLRTGGSAAWLLFTAREIAFGIVEYLLKTPVFDFTKNWAAGDDTAQTGTLAFVPGGIQVDAILGVVFFDNSAGTQSGLLVTSLDQSDTASVSTIASYVDTLSISGLGTPDNGRASGIVCVRTSTSRTFRYRGNGTSSDHEASFSTHGWKDSRL